MLSKEVIKRQQQKAIEICEKRRSLWVDDDIVLNETFLKHKELMSHEIIMANVEAALLDNVKPIFDPDDLIAGRLDLEWHEENDAKREEMAKRCEARGEYDRGVTSSSNGHMTPDYETLLQKGIGGVLKEVKERLAEIRFDDPDGIEKRKFYEAAIISLEAAERFQKRHYEEALRLAEAETDPQRKKNLQRMADALKKVPFEPAKTFFEALQAVWLYQVMAWVVREFVQEGRPDHLFYPYYKKDIEEGRITPDEAMMIFKPTNVSLTASCTVKIDKIRPLNGQVF